MQKHYTCNKHYISTKLTANSSWNETQLVSVFHLWNKPSSSSSSLSSSVFSHVGRNACWPIFMCWLVVLESGCSSLRHSQVVRISIPCCIYYQHCICQNVPCNNSLSVPSPLPEADCSTCWLLCCWRNSVVTEF